MEPRTDLMLSRWHRIAGRSQPLLLGLLLCLAAPHVLAENQAQERLLKAAFIYNFAKFTDWPSNAFDNSTSPLHLCVLGHDDLSGELRRLTGRSVKGRSLSVLQLDGKTLPERCHMAYIATPEGRRLASQLSEQAVLTISQMPRFSRSGGIIELYNHDGKVRFNINRATAQRAGIHISSRLLKLAHRVDG